MEVKSLGKIAPSTAGTPVRITADESLRAHRLIISQIAGTTGKVVAGLSGLNRTTLASAVKQFLPPGANGGTDVFILESPGVTNQIRVSDFWVDADNNSEGVIVSYTVA